MYFQNHFEILDTLQAAYMYQVTAVNDTCSNFLINVINCSNVCDIYEFSSSYSFQQVEYNCLKFIDRHAEEVLKSPAFLKLKSLTVSDIIKRHSLDVPTEIVIFRAILTWGFNDCLRRGVDSENVENILKSVRSLLRHVRFLSLSLEEMSDPEVDKFYKLLNEDDLASKRRSLLNLKSKARTGTVDSLNLQPREYVENYIYDLQTLNCDEHAVRNGETFCLRIEGLKSRIFLTGVNLAFDRFVNNKNTSCLYVTISATNVKTTDQVCARGAFMTSNEETTVKLPSPLILKESESVEIALNVKRAINICPMIIKSDSQIVMPESKDVAMKIVPSACTGSTQRSMFKGIRYFY